MPESKRVNDAITRSFDETGDWLIVDSPNHHWVHQGYLFTAQNNVASIGASSWISIEFTTPSSSLRYMHLKEIDVNPSWGLSRLSLFEATTNGSTHTAGASTLAEVNHNRNSTIVALAGLASSAANIPSASTVLSTQYTLLIDQFLGSSGTATTKNEGLLGNINEYLLKPNTTYVLYLLNSGAGGAGTLKMTWYEIPVT